MITSAKTFRLVMVTAPNGIVARRLARLALQAHLAACVNLVPHVQSHYWWQGRLESGKEILLLFKTKRSHLKRLERLIREHHPYDTPEFIAFPLESGSDRYVNWLQASLPSSV